MVLPIKTSRFHVSNLQTSVRIIHQIQPFGGICCYEGVTFAARQRLKRLILL
jgi:hypothetical protein